MHKEFGPLRFQNFAGLLRGAGLSFLTLASLLIQPAVAESHKPAKSYKQKIEAGLIYNFLKYTTWPDQHEKGRLSVCLFGGDSFNGYLNPLQGRTAQQHEIDIVETDDMEDLDSCNLIFIASDQEDSLSDILDYTDGLHILTVSDIDGFTSEGGMVEFSTGDDDRIHLWLNKDAIDDAGLRIDDRLARLSEEEGEEE